MNTQNTAQIELERTPPPCDRCGHPSLTVVAKPLAVFDANNRYSLQPHYLSFCNHHFAVNEALLGLTGWALVADTRQQLATCEATRTIGGLR